MKDYQKKPPTKKNQETDKIVTPDWKHPYAVDSTIGTRHLLQENDDNHKDNDDTIPKNQMVETHQCLIRLQRHVHDEEQELELLREEYTLQQERLATLWQQEQDKKEKQERKKAAASKKARKGTTTKRRDASAQTKSKKRQASHKQVQAQAAVHPNDGHRRSARLLQQQQQQETTTTTRDEEDPANEEEDDIEECDLGNHDLNDDDASRDPLVAGTMLRNSPAKVKRQRRKRRVALV